MYFPISLGAWGLGSTDNALPSHVAHDKLSDQSQLAVTILGLSYLAIDIASYIPSARVIAGSIRIALAIISAGITLVKYEGHYRRNALIMAIGQVARAALEIMMPYQSGVKASAILDLVGTVGNFYQLYLRQSSLYQRPGALRVQDRA